MTFFSIATAVTCAVIALAHLYSARRVIARGGAEVKRDATLLVAACCSAALASALALTLDLADEVRVVVPMLLMGSVVLSQFAGRTGNEEAI